MGSPRKEHEAHYTSQNNGMLEVSGMEEDEKQYNPSMVVTKKNAKHKGTRKGNGLEGPTKSVLNPPSNPSSAHKHGSRSSVKGKKAIARGKVSKANLNNAVPL